MVRYDGTDAGGLSGVRLLTETKFPICVQHLLLIASIVTTSKAPVTTSVALVHCVQPLAALSSDLCLHRDEKGERRDAVQGCGGKPQGDGRGICRTQSSQVLICT